MTPLLYATTLRSSIIYGSLSTLLLSYVFHYLSLCSSNRIVNSFGGNLLFASVSLFTSLAIDLGKCLYEWLSPAGIFKNLQHVFG